MVKSPAELLRVAAVPDVRRRVPEVPRLKLSWLLVVLSIDSPFCMTMAVPTPEPMLIPVVTVPAVSVMLRPFVNVPAPVFATKIPFVTVSSVSAWLT